MKRSASAASLLCLGLFAAGCGGRLSIEHHLVFVRRLAAAVLNPRAWSPDGKRLVAGIARLAIVDVASGHVRVVARVPVSIIRLSDRQPTFTVRGHVCCPGWNR